MEGGEESPIIELIVHDSERSLTILSYGSGAKCLPTREWRPVTATLAAAAGWALRGRACGAGPVRRQ
jgi:hypothetical protein